LGEVEAELGRIRRVRAVAAGGLVEWTASARGLFTVLGRGSVVVGIRGEGRRIAAAEVGQLRHDALAVLREVGLRSAGQEMEAGGSGGVDSRG
jgi:hypothetical protein